MLYNHPLKKDNGHKLSKTELDLYNIKLDFDKVTPKLINEYLEKIKYVTKSTLDKIAKLDKKATFKDLYQAEINLDIITAKAEMLISFLHEVSPDPKVREASLKAEKDLSKFSIDCSLREDVFKAYETYFNNNYKTEKKNLSDEENRLVEKTMISYKRNGILIKDYDKKKTIKEIKKELSELCLNYNNNINEDKTEFELTKKDLEGLEEKWLKDKKIENKDDLYKVTLAYPDIQPILKLCKNRDTRKNIYVAFSSKAKEKNIKIMSKVVKLRAELAKLLGYKNYADYINEVKMSVSADKVGEFLFNMVDKFKPLQQKEIKELTEFARKHSNNKDFKPELYDISFYSNLLKQAKFDIDMQEVKKYFPLNNLLAGTFKIYEEILGLKFVETKASKWADDVKTYDVYDYKEGKRGNKIGSFFLDLHPRKGKFGHAAVFPLIMGCDLSNFNNKNGARQLPMGAMVCNFPKGDTIPFNQVVTLFHEFGHLMHGMCSKTKLPNHHGTRVQRDFVEAPSQMLERWCTSEKALKLMSSHIETGKPLPKELAEKLFKMDKFMAGTFTMRQLSFGVYDYNIHTIDKDNLKNLDLNKTFTNIQKKLTGFNDAKGSCFPASFGHLTGGYAAGYYDYLWSNMYASAMFKDKFSKDPLSKKAGKEYRDKILKPGGSKDANLLIKDFLGYLPGPEALLEEYGLKLKKGKAEKKHGVSIKL